MDEMMLQFHPEHASLGTNNIIVVWIVSGPPAVDIDGDLMFSGLFGSVLESASAHVHEKRSKPW
jgi:hypothetical protein